MRYFLITFNLSGKKIIASLTFEIEKFPSHSYIEEIVNKNMGYQTSLVILNIFEFKNEEDYKNYLDL